jgi:uroporphyrinogen-III synthase
MRLLVTRPEPDASETAAKLRALGHEVLVEPLLTIAFNSPPAQIAKPAALIFSSMNGGRAIATWPVARGWNGVPVFALAGVADAITALAPGIAAGIKQVHGGVHTGADLAEAVRVVLPAGSGPVLYPAALDRSGELETALIAAGYDLRIVEAYRADPVQEFSSTTRDALARGQVDGVLLCSRRTAETYLRVGDRAGITAELRMPSYYVISRPVADLLSDLAAAVHVAKFPNEDSLLALIPAPR